MPIDRAGRKVESSGDLRDGHPDEVPHLDDICSFRVFQRQRRERVVHRHEFLGRHRNRDAGFMQFVANQVRAMFEPLFATGDINENLLHRSGGGLEEMPAIGEMLVTITGDLQPGFMHESRGLQSLSGFFIGHPDDRELAQFSIDQGEQFLGGFGIALVNAVQNLCHFAYRRTLQV